MNQQHLLRDQFNGENFKNRIMNSEFIEKICKIMKKKIFFIILLSLSFFLVGIMTTFEVKADNQLAALIKNINNSDIFFLKTPNNNCSQVELKSYFLQFYYDFDTKLSFNKKMLAQ